ncbi:MAG: hypothetical protein GTO40_26115 [Deltaproteobacteria bacterium]|nr:hypothetical protein [Deltaproteobacteria bacterium]
MRKLFGVILAGGALALLVGGAAAHWQGGYGPGRGMSYGPGASGEGRWEMGYGMRGRPGMAWGRGEGICPGFRGATSAAITEENAKEHAQQYADTHLPGFKVDKVLPFSGRHHTVYAVELKNSDGELRTFHVNPYGDVMPFGGPWRRGS